MSEQGGDTATGDAASQRSSNTGASGPSETSSQRSDSKFLKKRAQNAHAENENETDLLEQKRNIQEGIFACMYTLARQSALSSWKWAVLKIVLEFMMNFRVVFNSSSIWVIDSKSPVWKVVTWTLWRAPIARMYGYKAYVTVMYTMASAVLLSMLGLAWLTVAMRKQEQSKMLRNAALALHVVYDIMYGMCYTGFFDYFTFTADCDFSGTKNHLYFKNVACFQMPHLLHMTVGLATGLLFMCVTALLLVASCDLDPVSHGYLASPAAYTRLKILVAKGVYIISANILFGKLSAVGMIVSVSLITYWNLRAMPFYRTNINIIWTGLWGGVLYPCVLLAIVVFGKDQSKEYIRWMTKNVLNGIFPVVLGSMGLAALHSWWAMRPARKFRNPPPGVKLARIHKFEDVDEVERLARVMRVFDADGLVEQEAAAYGEVIIKAGMQAFPNSPHLLILYANFVLEARKDGPASRTQLQLAGKATPNLVERYQIFCTNEASKRLKDSVDGGMDLQAYIEFKRNFRAVLRVHKEAMLQQAEVWQLCMRSSVKVAQMDAAMEALEAAGARAHQVYRRVLERYPTNGKLLRCYGKFLEDCRHDQLAAARAYGEANRNGGASNSGLLALDLSGAGAGGAAGKPDFLTSMSIEDDAVVVTDSEGRILMVSQAVQALFGYAKTELEGANVSLLMPQPFSQRHPGYMARYVASGEPHILDNVRQVVALHKERYVFPVSLCITKLSGTGTDSVFLGLFRQLAPNLTSQRAWISPNGVFLCADQHFASSVGIMEGELVGHTLSSLVADPEEVERLLQRCREATIDVLESGSIQAQLLLRHRYLEPVPVDVTVSMAGSDFQRILVLHCARTDGQDGGMLAVDRHMRIRFASCEVALLTGYPLRRLAAMKLPQLLPPPYNVLHAKWLRETPHAPPPGSCRSGAAVHLLTEAGAQVAVKIKVSSVEGDAAGLAGAGVGGTLHVIQVSKLSADEEHNDKRLILTADFSGRVLEVSPRDSAVFDFPTDSLLGTCLSDSIDLFDDWRKRSGDGQMQLLLLALLDKESEMPGTSWRVKVQPPSAGHTELPPLPGQAKASRKHAVGRTACLQVDLLEGDGAEGGGSKAGSEEGGATSGSRICVSLWRRDLLSGVVELDEELTVRKASPLTALITGLPVTAMLRKPLGRLLDLPPAAATWEQLVSACAAPSKKSALKASSERGSISPLMAFIGPHPDTGTMRLLVQGVQTLGPTGRPRVTLTVHPDATFVGAHADLMRVLKLNGAEAGHDTHDSHAGDASAGELEDGGPAAEPAAPTGGRPRTVAAARLKGQSGRSLIGVSTKAFNISAPPSPRMAGIPPAQGDEAEEDAAEGAQEAGDVDKEPLAAAEAGPLLRALHRQATSRSEFVEQWVKSLSNQLAGQEPSRQSSLSKAAERIYTNPLAVIPEAPGGLDGDGAGGAGAGHTGHEGALVLVEGHSVKPLSCGTEAPADHAKAEGSRCGGATSARPWSSRQPSRDVQSPPQPAAAKPKARGKGEDDDDNDGDKSDRTSENGGSSVGEGSQAASAISGTSDASTAEVVVDARRGRLLKALNKLLLGPSLLAHVNRLHVHSYALIAVMFLAHLGAYILLMSLIKVQHNNVYQVLGQALAMDRSQLIICRAITGSFCSRPGILPVSACAQPLNTTLFKLTSAINDMESFHQGVYLGLSSSKVTAPSGDVYNVWTSPVVSYNLYMDTESHQVLEQRSGAFVLGNRFIAAAREAIYLLPSMLANYMAHRTYRFIYLNGFGPMFEVYATSLDLLVEAAWNSVQKLRTELVVLLVVEAAFVQMCCTLYEMLLVRRLEQARLVGMLAMVALPGPVLRQLVASDQRKIIDDSDDEAEEEDSTAGDEDDKGQAGAAPGSGRMPGSSALADERPDAPDGRMGLASTTNGAVGWHSSVPDESAPEAAGEAGLGAPAGACGQGSVDVEAETKGLGYQVVGRTFKRLRSSKKATRDAAAVNAATHGSHRMQIHGKTLLPSHWNVSKFMAPFFLWNVAVVLVYGISLAKLDGMQGPLASLNMAAHVTYRYTRVRALSLAFVVEPLELRAMLRGVLSNELDLFESEYDALMYGGLPTSLMNSTFQRSAPAGTFESADFARKFFTSKGCFRYDQSKCFTPDSPYYEVTHNGLDALVRRMIREMRLLTLDADEDVAYNNTRYTFMAAVAGNDLYEGLQQATQLFVNYSILRYDEVTKLHEVLLVVSVFLVLGFLAFLLWPHSRRMLRDASRQSGLLSLVPPEVDVRGHVRGVFKRAAGAGRRG